MEEHLDTQMISRFFTSSEIKLETTLELIKSYQTVLQAGVNFARLFEIPLASDHKAASLGPLFSTPDPQVLHIEETSDYTVSWADVIRSVVYNAELQDDGGYHVRIGKGNALLKLSKADHEFIRTKIPQQLVDPHSYSSDLALEIYATRLANDRMKHWQGIIQQLTHANNGALMKLDERVEFLEGKRNAFETHACGLDRDLNIEMGIPVLPRRAETPSSIRKITQKKVKGGRGLPWSHDEVEKLPGWFKDHRHLSNESIEHEYTVFSGKDRSYSSLQSQLYKLGRGDLTNKRESASMKHKVPRETSTVAKHTSIHVPSLQSADLPQLSEAMTTISTSISNTGMSEIVAGKEGISPSRSAELVPTPDGVAINSDLSEGSGSADGERTRRETCGSSDGSVDRMERTSRQEFPSEELPPTPLQIVEQQASPVGPAGQSPSHESLRRIQEIPHGPHQDITVSAPQSLTSSTGTRMAPSHSSAPPEENGNVYILPERGTVTQTSILDKEDHTTGERFSTIEKCINGWKAVNQPGQKDGRESAASHPWDDKLGEEANGQNTASRPDLHPGHSLDTSGSTNHTTELARKRKRAYNSRTKTGCITCRRKKKKCDETQPSCENCSRKGLHCEGYIVPNSNEVSLAPATGASLRILGKRPVKILPNRSDRYQQSNEWAGNISSIDPQRGQEYTQASGVVISSDHMGPSNMEPLSGFASKRSQEKPLSNNGVPIVPQYTIPSIQHLFRDLDAARDMESTAQSRERDTLLGGDSRTDAAG